MNPRECLSVTVTIQLPFSNTPYSLRHELDPIMSEAFRALPREREFDYMSNIHAQQQLMQRSEFANMLGKQIAASIVNYVATEDPYNGYKRK